MLKASVTFNANDLTKDLSAFVKKVAEDAFDSAKKNTPVRTGNARRNWTKDIKEKSATIQNRVPYIERLEAGASRQAPQGILKPTLTEIKGKYK